MSALEREVIEKFYQLDKAAQQRVREKIALDRYIPADPATFDYDVWFAEVEAIRQQLRENHGGKLPPMHVVDLLRDIRDGIED